MKYSLTQIDSFGKDGADFEDNLSNYFLETDVYKKALNASKSVIIGRKGTGKSAIFKFLQAKDTNNNFHRLFLEPDGIILEKSIENEDLGNLSTQLLKNAFWKYEFLVLMAKFYLSTVKKEWGEEKKWTSEVKALRKFLVDNGEEEELKKFEKLKKISSKFKSDGLKIKIAALGELVFNKKDKKDLEIEFLESLNRIEKFLLEISNYPLFQDKRFIIYIDKVDDIWSNDEVSNNLVSGLLLGASEIHSKFKNIKCVTFLRTDIYQLLDFHNKDHFRSEELEINWSKESLKKLIYKRIEAIIPNDKIEEEIFFGEIDNVSILEYMIERTLFRPRDLIQFCNESLDNAKSKKQNSITKDNVMTAESKYSKWKIEDLTREYKSNYPFLNQILNYGKELGFSLSIVTRAEFKKNYDELKRKLEDNHSFFKNLDYDILLDVLYDINLIGTSRGENISYKYNDVQVINDLDNKFYLHPAFWNYYGTQIQNKGNTNDKTIVKELEVVKKEPAKKIKNESLDKKDSIQKNKIEKQVGSGAIKTKIEMEPIEASIQKLEDGFNKIHELSQHINESPASFIRMTFTTKQSIQLLKKFREKEKNYLQHYTYSDKVEFSKHNRHEIANIFIALEKSIDPLQTFLNKNEHTIGRSLLQHLKMGLGDLGKGLQGLYSIFLEEYEFDIFDIERTMTQDD